MLFSNVFPHVSRSTWSRPGSGVGNRRQDAIEPGLFEMSGVIMFFDMPQTVQFQLPEEVIEKLEAFAFCLFKQ